MKVIKSFLAISAFTTACTANAMVWDITMTENTYLENLNGPLIMNFSGTYDDAAPWIDKNGIVRQGVADVVGRVEIPGFFVTIDYSSVLFNMDFTTGLGYLNAPDISDCSSNSLSACIGFSPALKGTLYNDINFSFSNEDWGQKNTSTAIPFDPEPGVYTWTAVVTQLNEGQLKLFELPFTVTLSSDDGTWTPPTASVPEPNGIALLMAGLVGMFVARRDKMCASKQ